MTTTAVSRPSTTSVRVLMVGPSLTILGGQAVQATRLLARLRAGSRARVDFVAINPRLPGLAGRLQRVKYVRTIFTSLAYLWSLLRTVRRYDVVHAFSASYTSYLLAPLPALVVAKAFGKATLLNYRSGEAEDHLRRSPIAVLTMRWLADAIVVPSPYLVQVFAQFGLQAHPIANFIDPDHIPFRHRATPRPIFLSNRNLEPLYRISATIDAFAMIQRDVPDARLIVVGDGSERRALERRVTSLRLNNVQFVGRVPPAEMLTLYDHADIYLNSPDIDNMPGSIIEAFAAGLPVVTTDAGGIPQIVRHEEIGLVVPRGDARAIASAALRLLREPGLAGRLTTAARAECLRRYVWGAVKQEWLDIYDLLASPSQFVATAYGRPAGWVS